MRPTTWKEMQEGQKKYKKVLSGIPRNYGTKPPGDKRGSHNNNRDNKTKDEAILQNLTPRHKRKTEETSSKRRKDRGETNQEEGKRKRQPQRMIQNWMPNTKHNIQRH